MCSRNRASLIKLLLPAMAGLFVASCQRLPVGTQQVEEGTCKSISAVRALRRAYDGAPPPVIPHPPLGADCSACHDSGSLFVEGMGYAPTSLHGKTPGIAGLERCRQCHVFRETIGIFRGSDFQGMLQAVTLLPQRPGCQERDPDHPSRTNSLSAMPCAL